MARTVSFVLLVSLAIALAVVVAMVMRQFLLPLFFAVLLVVMFRPLHEWFRKKFPNRPKTAAGLTTLSIVAVVLIPLLLVLGQAALEGVALARSTDPAVVEQRAKQLLAEARKIAPRVGVELPPTDAEVVQRAIDHLRAWIAPAAIRTTQFVGSFLFGLSIMVVALYFFLVDGPDMLESIIKLTPMDENYLRHLLAEFEGTSRAVVLATLFSSLGQGLLAGVGYLVFGVPHLFLLTAATMLLTMVPFIGATIVWGGAAAWLYLFDGRPVAASLLAIWGLLVVSTADNFIKPYVLKGQSNLHPLLALLSVIGSVQTLGPIGIFIGPMIVSFLHALLVIIRTELKPSESPQA